MANQLQLGGLLYAADDEKQLRIIPTPAQRRTGYLKSVFTDHDERVLDRSQLRIARENERKGLPLTKAQQAQLKSAQQPRKPTVRPAALDPPPENFPYPMILLEDGIEPTFMQYYVPNWSLPTRLGRRWTTLPDNPNLMQERLEFAQRIVEAHRIVQTELDRLNNQGLFQPADVLDPIYSVCPHSGRLYPTPQYCRERDPFLHKQHLRKHPAIYNRVFRFNVPLANARDDPEVRGKAQRLSSLFGGYDTPHVAKFQKIGKGATHLAIPNSLVAAGHRGPWVMIDSTAKKYFARKFDEEAGKSWDKMTALTQDQPVAPDVFANIFNNPGPTNPVAGPSRAGPIPAAAGAPDINDQTTVEVSRDDDDVIEIPQHELRETDISVEIVDHDPANEKTETAAQKKPKKTDQPNEGRCVKSYTLSPNGTWKWEYTNLSFNVNTDEEQPGPSHSRARQHSNQRERVAERNNVAAATTRPTNSKKTQHGTLVRPGTALHKPRQLNNTARASNINKTIASRWAEEPTERAGPAPPPRPRRHTTSESNTSLARRAWRQNHGLTAEEIRIGMDPNVGREEKPSTSTRNDGERQQQSRGRDRDRERNRDYGKERDTTERRRHSPFTRPYRARIDWSPPATPPSRSSNKPGASSTPIRSGCAGATVVSRKRKR